MMVYPQPVYGLRSTGTNPSRRHQIAPTSATQNITRQKKTYTIAPEASAAVPAPTPPGTFLQLKPQTSRDPSSEPIPPSPEMPALTISTDKNTPTATAAAATPQPRAASPPRATQLPGNVDASSSSRPTLAHTTQQTPVTLPLAPGPEPIDFDANPDTIALKSAIAVLQLQRQRATADIQALSRAKDEAVGDPEAFVRDLAAGKVVRCPPINWSQYAVVGDSLDKLHAEQVARPTQGTPAAYIPGHAGMYEFRGGDGRQETYQGAAVPYNPVKDRVDRKATSKARK
ncbi:hypothetical protein BBAD15_g5904 [Beauveria bassiana D1-5]|uniref:Uncharacterized protein n=1 Tax=Beauveria bassiana D1-5 TaxID=1245745 RepID=A0A0A2VMD4_BEABA|nr:hypothetical protein BBAD15_g5904 [Beauveria bassiana D1-5]